MIEPRPSGPSRPDRAAAPSHAPLTEVECAILLTVLYADLFDYPLTEAELYHKLILQATNKEDFERALASLEGRYLVRVGAYVIWKGREGVVRVRDRRHALAPRLWASARRYAFWLARVPFVRMVAVSGSLAVENAEDQGDIDLFCITEPNRLWVARLFIVPLSKLTRRFNNRFPSYLCPNYILTSEALEVEEQNVFTAHEVLQAVPLWGGTFYHRFLAANSWVLRFLPHGQTVSRLHRLEERPRPLLTRLGERLLHKRLGDRLDQWVHRLFLTYYQRRADRQGWSWDRLGPAYRRDQYTVPEGGYIAVIHDHFRELVRQRLGPLSPEAQLNDLFPQTPLSTLDEQYYDWATLFSQEYSAGAIDASPTSPSI